MFQFRRFPTYAYGFSICYMDMTPCGFPHSEICGSIAYLQLPAAFRSLSRLSSALSAKASSLCSSSLNLLSGLAWPASWLLLLLLSDVLSLSRSFKRFLILVQYSVFKVQVFGCPLPAITGHNLFCPLITGKFSFPALLSFFILAATCSPMPSPA